MSQKSVFIVIYYRNMPEIDVLMQEWPAEFEDLLNEVNTFCFMLSFVLRNNPTR